MIGARVDPFHHDGQFPAARQCETSRIHAAFPAGQSEIRQHVADGDAVRFERRATRLYPDFVKSRALCPPGILDVGDCVEPGSDVLGQALKLAAIRS